MALVAVLAVASMTIGGTFAAFSDTETSHDNYIETGSLDLKVARSCGVPVFCDDKPWGDGLFPVEIAPGVIEVVPCFLADEVCAFDGSYSCQLILWNAGCVEHGRVYVHFTGVAAVPAGLLDSTVVTVWYDQNNDGSKLNGDGEIDEAEVVTGTLGELDCQPVPEEPVVWMLPTGEWRNLQIVIDPPDGAPGDSLGFHIEFSLIGVTFTSGGSMVNIGFTDTETCLDNCLRVMGP